MRITILSIALFFSIISCTQKQKNVSISGDFDFLLGDWERTNNKPGVITKEHWTIKSPTIYIGHGYTTKKSDTTFNEHMQLIKQDSVWILEVGGPNELPTKFTITSHTKNSLVAENPEHDFPKKISYSYFDDTLSAKVSNEEMEIPFIFWRIEK